MIAIHTYAPIDGADDELNKKQLFLLTLSCLLLKKSFRGVRFYTTSKIKKQVDYLNLPYDEVVVGPFEDLRTRTFSIPKLITYSLLREPFVHIDIDLLFYSTPRKFSNLNVFYSHVDIPIYKNTQVHSFFNLYDVYLKSLKDLVNIVDESIISHIDLFKIPNMSLFGGYYINEISDASKICLDIYNRNKEYFDSDFNNANIIEQLLMTSTIDMLMGKNERNFIMDKDSSFLSYVNKDINYPFTFTYNKNKVIINEEKDIYRYASFNFGYPIHLSNLKEWDIILFIIKESIIQNFDAGVEYVIKIDELYPKKEIFEQINDRYQIWISK
jgi:hypothetical protein